MQICVYIYIYIFMYICMYLCIYNIHRFVQICIYVHIHMYIYLCICIHSHTYCSATRSLGPLEGQGFFLASGRAAPGSHHGPEARRVHVLSKQAYTYMCVYVYRYLYIHMCIYIYMCIYGCLLVGCVDVTCWGFRGLCNIGAAKTLTVG